MTSSCTRLFGCFPPTYSAMPLNIAIPSRHDEGGELHPCHVRAALSFSPGLGSIHLRFSAGYHARSIANWVSESKSIESRSLFAARTGRLQVMARERHVRTERKRKPVPRCALFIPLSGAIRKLSALVQGGGSHDLTSAEEGWGSVKGAWRRRFLKRE
jgi:hypothetical protein